MRDTPIIRLELEQMKQSMMVALGNYHDDITANVDEQLTRAIKNFDWEAAVSRAASDAIRKAVDDYFKWGEGHTIIHTAVGDALDVLFAKAES